jgi:hypothetical protein
VEFREHNWSLKHLHRLICTSQTYRLSSSNLNADTGTVVADPDNKYYWRANPRRMEAQLVRDGLIYLAGDLDLTLGGPSIPVMNQNSTRRSLYFVHSHNDHQQFLSIFDDANVLECYRREESIVPQQALALENSLLAMAMAEKIAARILKRHPSAKDKDFVRTAFIKILGTVPNPKEIEISLAALRQLREIAKQKKEANPSFSAQIQLVHALLNHNDFITIR